MSDLRFSLRNYDEYGLLVCSSETDVSEEHIASNIGVDV
jgi:hypothetical protein